MDDFLIRALLAGLGVAAVAGPLGSFIVWRRMAYFGDALAHTALLGVALGLLFNVDITIGVTALCTAAALLIVLLQRRSGLASDTLLGIMAHGTLALGLVLMALVGPSNVDLTALLFGDVLAVTSGDIRWIYGGGMVALAALAAVWRPLLALTVHEDLARVEGAPVTAARLVFMVVLALTVAVAMKVVGVILITSLLIIPAAAARSFAATPEGMALLAVVVGSLAVVLGLWASAVFDAPAGPSIVVAAAALFLVSLLRVRRA